MQIIGTRYLITLLLGASAFYVPLLAGTSAVTHDQYVAEFLTPDKSDIAPEGWAPEEILIPDDELVRGLRAKSSDVVAVVILNAGIHPRWTTVFVEEGDHVRFIATLTFWGKIQEKRVGADRRSQFDEKIQLALGQLACHEELADGFLMRGAVYWEREKPRFCKAEIFGDEVLSPIMEHWLFESAEIRFSIWDK